MNRLCTDVGYMSMNKHGEQLCGDHVEVAWAQNEAGGISGTRENDVLRRNDSSIMVLADGLGSGVKASILSTLTAKIISTMMASSLSVEDCVTTIAATLPVRKELGIAYSTFTIIKINPAGEAEIIQYDNPHVIFLRNGKNVDYSKISETIDNKTIYKSRIALQENDTFVAMSDGVLHASTEAALNLDWERKDVVGFLENIYEPGYTAKTLSSMLMFKCYSLYGGEPGDDTTVATVKIRSQQTVNLLIGPPQNPVDLEKMMNLFFAKEGKHIVCGGTTSILAAEYLKKPLRANLPAKSDPEIPPTAEIEGVDLVTEGVITVHRVVDYANDYVGENENYAAWSDGDDGASEIARLLFEEATNIHFFVGRAVNLGQQGKEGISFTLKMKLIEELASRLKLMGKQVKVSYF